MAIQMEMQVNFWFWEVIVDTMDPWFPVRQVFFFTFDHIKTKHIKNSDVLVMSPNFI